MDISKLKFFDKNGEAYNLDYITNGSTSYWYGADYFLPISTALYDVSNIFILEETSGNYHFPDLGPNGKLTARWKTAKDSENFFLYTITSPTLNDDNSYLTKQKEIVIAESDFGQNFDFNGLKYPLQLNVAFTPFLEKAYTRELELFWSDGTSEVKIAELGFYGEGEDEDERFRVWLANFGVKFNREDAEILKNYDLKEGLPNWQDVNLARKELLVNRDQVYPYVGTYKGMINLINLMGYKDVLKVKEYWKNVDKTSQYYQKFAQVDITDMLDDGIIQNLDLVNRSAQIKQGERFAKTEFLALVYEFSQASGTFDEDGLPEVEFTTEFSVNEIFYKLNKLSEKLKVEILPINVVIRDIIGEFIYFEKFNIRYWSDRTDIIANELNEKFKVKILHPDPKSQELVIRNIKPLYPKQDLISAFPFVTFNISSEFPYKNGQLYDPAAVPLFIQAISSYYTHEKAYEYAFHGQTNPFKDGDDAYGKTGCPLVLLSDISELTLQELDGSSFDEFRDTNAFVRVATTTDIVLADLPVIDGVQTFNRDRILVKNQTDPIQNGLYVIDQGGWTRTTSLLPYQGGFGAVVFVDEGTVNANTGWYSTDNILGAAGSIAIVFASYTAETPDSKKSHHTIGTLKYRDSFETEWTITGPNNYYFNVRGKTIDYSKWPHVLPYTGDYLIELKVYDLSGGVSLDYIRFHVETEDPVVTSFIRIEDKFNYQFKNLENVMLQDFGDRAIYEAGVNVLDPDPGSLTLDSHYFNMFTYLNNFGLGTSINSVEIFNGVEYEDIKTSTLPAAGHWGIGRSGANLTIGDLANVPLGGLYHTRFSNTVFSPDFLNGFLVDPIGLITMKYGNFPTITVPPPSASNLELFVTYMNQVPFPGWSDYNYKIVGNNVKADAKFIDRKNHAILTFTYPNAVTVKEYTFQFPVKAYSEEIINWLETQFPQVERDLLFLDVPFDDLIAGLGGTSQYWIDRGYVTYSTTDQSGFLPSNFDQNAFDTIGIKITDDTLRIPLHAPVFSVMSNIDGKQQTIWTLYKGTAEIAKVKTISQFVWRFSEPGKYYLTAETTDNFGNVFKTPKPLMFAEVFTRDEYIEMVETALNRRKLTLTE
jgi:hypothetical protein